MIELIGAVFALIGSLFMLVSAIGLLRFPDIYTRIHASSVAPSMGFFSLLVAVICFFPSIWSIAFAAIIMIINFLTSPLTAHLIARASCLTVLTLWKQSDEEAGNS